MNEEQKQKMRDKFENWYDKSLAIKLEERKQWVAYLAFQAAYTPRPEVEVVARAITHTKISKEFRHDEDWKMSVTQAQAAIDAIFNKENI